MEPQESNQRPRAIHLPPPQPEAVHSVTRLRAIMDEILASARR
jgi:hypothetical protein